MAQLVVEFQPGDNQDSHCSQAHDYCYPVNPNILDSPKHELHEEPDGNCGDNYDDGETAW